MTWTNEPPCRDGWYFVKTLIGEKYYVRTTHVHADSRGRMWSGSTPGSRGSRVKEDPDTQWAGPIPEPTEE